MTAALQVPRNLEGWSRAPGGLYLPDAPPRGRPGKLVGVDLFAGAGGFSLGMHYAGWHVAAALELDRDAAATYLVNLGGPDTVVHHADGTATRCGGPGGFTGAGTGWIAESCSPTPDGPVPDCTCAMCVDAEPVEHLWMRDIREVTGAEIVGALGLEVGDVGCVFGGPPCQGFSLAGHQDVMDPRNSLVFEFARLVLEVRPATMIMENVPNILRMLTPAGVPVIDALARVLADGGFSTYDALRKSLGASPTARGAVRQEQTGRPADRPDEDAATGLFDLDELGTTS